MNQLDLFQIAPKDSGKLNRDAGIKKAIDHAGENWAEQAYEFLLQFIRHDKIFMAENVREASKGIVPEPPHLRAWGGIILKARAAGLIRKRGTREVSNPKAHCAIATLWEAA